MDKELVVISDYGQFKAYYLMRDRKGKKTPRLELCKALEHPDARLKTSDKLSDSRGRFGGGDKSGGKNSGCGEKHEMDRENRRRLASSIAEDIERLIKEEKCAAWYLAAGATLNNSLMKCVSAEAKSKLAMNVKADLTHMKKAELLERFDLK